MFTKAELIDAINELEAGKHSIQNCEKLAAIYTVLDHLYTPDYGYSYDNKVEAEAVLGNYGDSEFLTAAANKPIKDVLMLMNELIEALSVLNPKLMMNFLDRLKKL